MTFFGGLLAIPIDNGAAAVASGIVFLFSCGQKVVLQFRLPKENTVAAAKLASRVERLKGAFREQSKVPVHITSAWPDALARMWPHLDTIREFAYGAPSQAKRRRKRDRWQRVWGATKVAAQLADRDQALSDLSADLGFVTGADRLAAGDADVRQLREGLAEACAGLVGTQRDVRDLAGIVLDHIAACAQAESSPPQSTLRMFDAGPVSPVSAGDG
jgi:hypothetical protein